MSSNLQSKLRKLVDRLRLSLLPEERARLADSLHKMSIDWLEASPQRRSTVLREANSRIIREFAPSESRRPGSPLISRPVPSHSSQLSDTVQREVRKLEKQLGKLKQQLSGVRAAARTLGDLTNREVKSTEKRVLSAAGRAAIVKAAKKRWAKVRKQAKKTTG